MFFCLCTYIFTYTNNQTMFTAFWISSVEHWTWDEIFLLFCVCSVFIFISFLLFLCLFCGKSELMCVHVVAAWVNAIKKERTLPSRPFIVIVWNCFPFAHFRLSLFLWQLYKIKTHVYCTSEFQPVMYAK